MYDRVIKKIIHIFIAIFITTLVATIIALLILKYNIEGEENMPFELSKIMIISGAEGIDISPGQQTGDTRKLDIVQNNDIFLQISKNKNYEDTEIIDEIIIDNIKIEDAPELGTIKMYKPMQEEKENLIYENSEENEIKEQLIYTGKENSNIKNLEIANQGSLIPFRCSIQDLGIFETSSQEIKINNNGLLLSEVNVSYKNIKCKVSFDLSIKLKSGIIYTGKITLDLPVGNIVQEGVSHYERTNLNDIIFRRNLR